MSYLSYPNDNSHQTQHDTTFTLTVIIAAIFFNIRMTFYPFSTVLKTSIIFQRQRQLSSKQHGFSVLRRVVYRYLISNELQNAIWLWAVWSSGSNMGSSGSGRNLLFFFLVIGVTYLPSGFRDHYIALNR